MTMLISNYFYETSSKKISSFEAAQKLYDESSYENKHYSESFTANS